MYMKMGKFSEAKPFLEKAGRPSTHNLERLNQMGTDVSPSKPA